MEEKMAMKCFSKISWAAAVMLIVPVIGPADASDGLSNPYCIRTGVLGSSMEKLDAGDWPGPPSSSALGAMKEAKVQLRTAFDEKDTGTVYEVVKHLATALGTWSETPEVRSAYGSPINAAKVDYNDVEERWFDADELFASSRPWTSENAISHKEKKTTPRLRESQRVGRGYLYAFEAGNRSSTEFLAQAEEVYQFLLTQQSNTGVFGFPYSPSSKNRLSRQAAALADRAREQGVQIVEGGYLIIDPTGDGALQFDNGVIGLDLIYLYWLTGNDDYLVAAKRAGDWALTQPLSTNWNYNGFSLQLLSRLYRATGEARYLDGAREFAELGVIPGQRESGRWVDPHNARIQYHSVMMIALIEYAAALRSAQSPRAEIVEKHVLKGLDNLAMQVNCYGASNVHELLSVEALALGSIYFEPRILWARAMDISVNYMMDGFDRKMIKAGFPLPHSLMAYRLYRAVIDGTAQRNEYNRFME